MSPILWTALFLASGATAARGQTTWYVDDDRCPSHGSGTAADPFCAIQDGIAAALDGDTVLVLPGIYAEAIHFLGPAIVVKSRDGAAATSITGNGVDPVVTFDRGESRDTVLEGFTITGAGYRASAGGILCLSSPTIRGNVVRDNVLQSGTGGISSRGDALIVDNEITGNGSEYATGGMYLSGGSVATGNRIVGNGSAYSVGGLSLFGDSIAEGNWIDDNGSAFHVGGVNCSEHAVLRRNTIIRNSTTNASITGLQCSGYSLVEGNRILDNTFTDERSSGCVSCRDECVFKGNVVAGNEGGVNCSDSPTIVDNLITGNTYSGGIRCFYATVTLVNNTVCGNSSFDAGAITCINSTVTISNSIFWNDQGDWVKEIYASGAGTTVTISWSDVEGGTASVSASGGASIVWGPGMIDADPGFVDPDGLDDDPATHDDNDFHLTAPSPCVDAGDNTAAGLPADDFEGDPRPFDVPSTPDTGNGTPPLADLGCDEFGFHLYFKGDATPGGRLALDVAGLPGGAPVFVWIATDLLDPPIPTHFGSWFLAPPLYPVQLQPIPASGVTTLVGNLPSSLPGPYTLHAQGFIGSAAVLVDLAHLEVR